MTDKPVIAFRSLKGLAELTKLQLKAAEHPNPQWAPEVDQIERLVPHLSRQWFGIEEGDAIFPPEVDFTRSREELEDDCDDWAAEHFAFLALGASDDPAHWEREHEIWASLGWDVRDGDGEFHPCMHHFARQMVVAAKGLAGRMPDVEMSDEQAKDEAEAWARRMLGKQA